MPGDGSRPFNDKLSGKLIDFCGIGGGSVHSVCAAARPINDLNQKMT